MAKVVHGEGPQTAKLAILGEAPGYHEDRLGRPFVGKSGQLLRKYLVEAGLKESDVYFTNVVKTRPPNNETPSTEDIKAAIPSLVAEFSEMPNLQGILMVGNVPMQALTAQRGGITKKQGTILPPRREFEEVLKKVRLIPSVHPAYVLRNRSPQVIRGFQTCLGAFKEIGEMPPWEDVIYVNDGDMFETFLTHVNKADFLALDIESTPVPWWHEDFKILTMAVAVSSKRAFVVTTPEHPEAGSTNYLEKTLDKLSHPLYQKDWVWHNGKYDVKALKSYSYYTRFTNDTLVAQYVLDPDQPKGLEHLASYRLGLAPYKDVDYKHILEEPLDKIVEMNGIDAIRTYRLWDEFYRDELEANPRQKKVYDSLVMPASKALINIELAGLPVDQNWLFDLEEKVEAEVDRVREWFQDKYGKTFNPGSYKSVRKLLYSDLGYPVKHYTDKGDPATSRTALIDMPQSEDVIKLLEYRKWRQRLGTFVRPWLDMLTPSGTIHPNYKPAFVTTGRLSSEKPNIQQVPKEPEFRGVFGALPGHMLIDLDYSQIELRLAAAIAGEKQMLKAYRQGADLHTQTAELVLGDPAARQVGKILNFGLLYGAQPKKLQEIAKINYGVELTSAEAQEYHRRFFEAYPSLAHYHKRAADFARRTGYIDTMTGRIRYLPDIDHPEFVKRMEAERQAINTPIQSLASDIMLYKLTNYSAAVSYQSSLAHMSYPIATVHDSLIIVAATEAAEQTARWAQRYMEDISDFEEDFGIEIMVPMVVDYKIGERWT